MKLCFATNNKNKLAELRSLLGSPITILSIEEVGLSGDIPETGDTLEANSLQKATFIFEKTGIATIADDTGLEVDALNGRPGVYSARYAGPDGSAEANMQKLLGEMEGKNNRKACFKTVITLLDEHQMHQFLGTCCGEIRHEKSGAQGFGYDPLFQPEGFDVTFAEMDMATKNSISHRGRATQQLVAFLNEHYSKL